MLDFYEPPDPYVPAAEWAVVNVSGQRFHINMKHIKEYHKGRNLLICNGSQFMNPDISGALPLESAIDSLDNFSSRVSKQDFVIP